MAMDSTSLDIHLDIHERMIDNMGASLIKTKKRLYETELTMNLRPPDNEPAEVNAWNRKVETIISKRDHLQFPKLHLVKREHEEAAAVLSKKKSVSITEWNEKVNQTLLNQIDNLQARVKKRGEKHTSHAPGTVIGTINNYNGCNSFYKGSRTLVRKESSSWEPPEGSNLPPWFGPFYYYPNCNEYNPNRKPDNSYQLAFKASERHVKSSERQRRQKIAKRKEEIHQLAQQQLEQEQSEHEYIPSFGRSPSRNKNVGIGFRDESSFNSPPQAYQNDSSRKKGSILFLTEDSDHGENMSLSLRENSDCESTAYNALEDAKYADDSYKYINEDGVEVIDTEQQLYVRSAVMRNLQLQKQNSINQALGVGGGKSVTSMPSLKTVSTPGGGDSSSYKHLNNNRSNSPSRGGSRLNTGSKNSRRNSHLSVSKSLSSLHISSRVAEQKSVISHLTAPLQRHLISEEDMPIRPISANKPRKIKSFSMNPRTNPVHTANPFAVKLLGIHTGKEPKRFKVKDYTQGAFLTQQSMSSVRTMSCEYEEESVDTTVSKGGAVGRRGALTTDNSLVSNPNINIKYSSVIFKVPNINYSSSTPVTVRNNRVGTTLESAAANVTDEVKTADIVTTEVINIEDVVIKPALLADVAICDATAADIPKTRDIPPVQVETHVHKTPAKSLPPPSTVLHLEPLPSTTTTADSEIQRLPRGSMFKTRKSVSEVNRMYEEKILKNRRKTDMFVSKLLYPGKDQLSAPIVTPVVANTLATLNSNENTAVVEPIIKHSLDISTDVSAGIADWYAKNEIYAPSKEEMKKIRRKDSFLFKHAELPSIELSLNGLLLDENPYTKDSELIRKSLYGDKSII